MAEEKSTILVVEDDADVADMLSAYFRVQGYEVLVANWGEKAVSIAQRQATDLVILDIRLPDIDGYEVARRLRSSRRTEEIPILFLTEKRERADRLQGLELGADDYITKPFDIQELRLRVRNAIRRASQGALTNPVTGLAEGTLVEERLRECLGGQEWAMLQVSLENLDGFRDAYGFVASDDVQRAVSLMIHNAVRSAGSANDFVGQLTATDFLLVTTPASLPALEERIRSRLDQSLEYFYPLKDREPAAGGKTRLSIRTSRLLSSEGNFPNLASLRAELSRRKG